VREENLRVLVPPAGFLTRLSGRSRTSGSRLPPLPASRGGRHARYAAAAAADAGEHLLADEAGEQAGHFSGFDAGKFEQHAVEHLLAGQIDGLVACHGSP